MAGETPLKEKPGQFTIECIGLVFIPVRPEPVEGRSSPFDMPVLSAAEGLRMNGHGRNTVNPNQNRHKL